MHSNTMHILMGCAMLNRLYALDLLELEVRPGFSLGMLVTTYVMKTLSLACAYYHAVVFYLRLSAQENVDNRAQDLADKLHVRKTGKLKIKQMLEEEN
ncbi:hypothetical protein CK203_074871 [Vitis vinifera]|uniref:Uncharacterized protein n=1 Tax=Vitis vinifera TaxID=29760 RepID=A0A438DE78_VITVI|nr:hypothetical protein CK203_074871 [Vitis vinifera]